MNQEFKSKKDTREYRNALGQFPTGVAIVTALTDDLQPVGMTINSLTSISMAPALISWNIDHGSASYKIFTNAKSFAVTVLAQDQVELALRFATQGANKFQDIEINGNEPPVIPNGCAWFKCETYRSILLGDHTMLVGKVIEFDKNHLQPLVFKGGQFQQSAPGTGVTTRAAA
jgi:flavin reductase (DIM6/NTAB) family NADH-FMN oxidoreductase RutF